MLEFSGGVGLGVDIGDLLELQRALHAERIVQIPADEEHGIVIEILRGVILDLLAAGQDLLDLRGQRGDGGGQAVRLFGADRIALCGEIDSQQIQHSHLRGIRLGRRHGDLRPGPGVEHVVRFAGDGAADDVDDGQNPRAEALCLAQRGHGVERLAGLADNNGKRPFVYNRAAIAELGGQNDLDRHPRQLFEVILADHAHMIRRAAGDDLNAVVAAAVEHQSVENDRAIPDAGQDCPAQRLGLLHDLLEHEMLIAALFRGGDLPVDVMVLLFDGQLHRVIDLHAVAAQNGDLAVFHVHNVARVLDKRRHVGGDEVLALAEADEQRRVLARSIDMIGIVRAEDAKRICALDPVQDHVQSV